MRMKTQRLRPRDRWWTLGLGAVGAVLLAVAAGIHLDLYLTEYRSIGRCGTIKRLSQPCYLRALPDVNVLSR